MLGFLERGLDVRILFGERRPATSLAARFAPLLGRTIQVETLRELHLADLAELDRGHPGKVDAFLQRVGTALGRSTAELRDDPLVLRACTFARLVELSGARYLQSWFFYDQSFMAMFAGCVLGIPRGISCHVDHMLDDFAFKLVPLQLATADLVLAISQRTRDELVGIGGDECAPRILIKRIGVDGSVLRRWRGRERKARALELISICRLEPKKGLLFLIAACKLLRDRGRAVTVRLIGGEDPEHTASAACAAELQRAVTEHGLQQCVLFEGAVASDRIPVMLVRADAFVAPYVELANGDADGIPTAMVEAMAAGLPIVCTDAGAIGEVVTDGVEGLVVPQRDAAALASAIERLQDDALRHRLGQGAAARFDREFDCRVTDVELHRRVRELIGR
jgi:glycosyltransferase involved in cell wall biosynthesis